MLRWWNQGSQIQHRCFGGSGYLEVHSRRESGRAKQTQCVFPKSFMGVTDGMNHFGSEMGNSTMMIHDHPVFRQSKGINGQIPPRGISHKTFLTYHRIRPPFRRGFRPPLTASGLVASEPVFHLLGDSRTGWHSVPLPFDLGGFGAPGCAVLAEPEIVEGIGASDAAGERRFTIRIPDDLALVGATFYHQVLGLAPGANPAGLIVSNGGALTIGTR